MATLQDLEARVGALEAAPADYRAVLAAISALGENQREYTGRMNRVEDKVDGLATTLNDTNARVRSLEVGQAEIKALLIRALDR